MEKNVVIIEARREGYSVGQINSTMTVGDLISYLEQFDEETPVYLSHDNGYTYGGIHYQDIEDKYIDTEE